jgi:aspartate racemase
MDMGRNEKQVWRSLESNLKDLAKRVDLFCIACNTLHYYSDRIIRMGLSAKFVSIVDPVADYVKQNGISRMAILGVCSVVEPGMWSPYERLEKTIELERPNCKRIEELVLLIKKSGADNPSIRRQLTEMISGLKSETVLLACTELPLVHIEVPGKRVIDSTLLLADEVVRLSVLHYDRRETSTSLSTEEGS